MKETSQQTSSNYLSEELIKADGTCGFRRLFLFNKKTTPTQLILTIDPEEHPLKTPCPTTRTLIPIFNQINKLPIHYITL